MVQLLLVDAGNFFLAMLTDNLMWRPMWFWVKVMWVLRFIEDESFWSV